MKKNILTIGASLLISSTILLTSCEKVEDIQNVGNNASYTSTQDNTDAQKKFDDVHRIFEKELKSQQETSEKRVAADCETITFDATAKTLVIDFGTTGCTDSYGTVRKGKIKVSYTGGRYIDVNTVITITLEDYSVDGDKIEGTQTVTNKGEIAGKQTYEVKVMNGKITYASGKTASWTSTRTRVLEDAGTVLPFDEIYTIYGDASGVDRDGLAYTMKIEQSTALKVDMKCWLTTRLPISGILTITPEGLETRSIDYGTGDCDRSVTVAIGSFSQELSL